MFFKCLKCLNRLKVFEIIRYSVKKYKNFQTDGFSKCLNDNFLWYKKLNIVKQMKCLISYLYNEFNNNVCIFDT